MRMHCGSKQYRFPAVLKKEYQREVAEEVIIPENTKSTLRQIAPGVYRRIQ